MKFPDHPKYGKVIFQTELAKTKGDKARAAQVLKETMLGVYSPNINKVNETGAHEFEHSKLDKGPGVFVLFRDHLGRVTPAWGAIGERTLEEKLRMTEGVRWKSEGDEELIMDLKWRILREKELSPDKQGIFVKIVRRLLGLK